MSTDTPGGCYVSVQPTLNGAGHNGQDNAHIKRGSTLVDNPELLRILKSIHPEFKGITVDYLSDSVKLALKTLWEQHSGRSIKDITNSLFQHNPLPNIPGVNGPAAMYIPDLKGIIMGTDHFGFRYASHAIKDPHTQEPTDKHKATYQIFSIRTNR